MGSGINNVYNDMRGFYGLPPIKIKVMQGTDFKVEGHWKKLTIEDI